MDSCFSFDVFALGTWIVIVDLKCKKTARAGKPYAEGYVEELVIGKEVSCLI